ncbi:RNA polymerase sigma factor [Fimbriimonas ginsengisoli]|uniref:RNA polymerase sigma factor, sigma-70 family n=1 Tax=Fimbriimonas ginsengisoli Gsoil 348 TaxID=661478 RepID=A0A068NUT8_FIMGI|nr:sigma-70 family RNA polymerase sigma factor [Fimbriimonas ginsengisoli]AIE87211.1 RNA polymerase sigma factor, sigma-70 family [Fimbriimonas ginsengisoli Gsoil 348]
MLRAAQGDRQAFGRLIDATRTTVCSIALAVVRDVEASEDVAQDVYLHAWHSLPTLRNSSSFVPWLRQLARNRAHAFLRKENPARRRPLDAALETVLADDRPGPETCLLERAERDSIREALDELNTDAREVLILFYREEQSVRQVATLLDLSEAAVKKRLERARNALKEALDRGLSATLERTKPGAAFSLTVVALLPPLVPAAAVASKGALAYLGTTKLVAILGSILLSSVLGLAGMLFGYYRLWRRARDEQERRGLQRLALWGSVSLVALVAFMDFATGRRATPILAVLWYGLLLAQIWYQQYVAIPRITARRLALERAEDPLAAARQAREKRNCNLGFVVGVLLGSLAIAYAMWRHG